MKSSPKRSPRPSSVFVLGAALGLLGESVLLMRAHCRKLEAFLTDDFRVLAFLRESLEESRLKVVEERLRSEEGVEALRYVSPTESLREIERDDPGMTRAVALLGDNPLPGAFELQVAANQIPRMPEWQKRLESIPEIGEIRYKPLEARALVHVQFYARFLTLTLMLAAFLCLVRAAWGVWDLFVAQRGPVATGAARRAALRAAWAGAGALFGVGAAILFASPASAGELLRAWPPASEQALLVATAVAGGWSLGLSRMPGRGLPERRGSHAFSAREGELSLP